MKPRPLLPIAQTSICFALRLPFLHLGERQAQHVGVEAAAQALVGGDDDDADLLDRVAVDQERMAVLRVGVRQMCAATLRIFSPYGRAARMRSCALRIFEAATISIALVILRVFCTLLILVRISLLPAMRLVLDRQMRRIRSYRLNDLVAAVLLAVLDGALSASSSSADRSFFSSMPSTSARVFGLHVVAHGCARPRAPSSPRCRRSSRCSPRTASAPFPRPAAAGTAAASCSSVTMRPRSSCLRVASSRSEANCANAASSRYCASARRTPPPSLCAS